MRAAVVVLILFFVGVGMQRADVAYADPCGDLAGCGVTGQSNHFHGVLAVSGEAWVLDASASGGTTAGCGDCSWSLIPACVVAKAGEPDTFCNEAGTAPTCGPGQLLFRLFLSTNAFVDRDEGVVCIGGKNQPIPVGDIGVQDVARYLDNVTPPDLAFSSRPRQATLAGFRTYFSAAIPNGLRPSPFGGPTVTETITITPTQTRWQWGDGDATGWLAPTGMVTHAYLAGGVAHGRLTTRWHASYTISYAGRSFGPYDAPRGLTKTQRFRLPVRTSSPTLVSH